jgi:lysophospholipase L1-like esterase
LVFSFGVNDCVTKERGQPRVPEAASIINARNLLGTAKAWLPTLMIGPPPTSDNELNRRVKHLSDRLGALCNDLSIPFLSPWDRLLTDDTWRRDVEAGDGAHPNRGGYTVLADLIMEWPPWRSWVIDERR